MGEGPLDLRPTPFAHPDVQALVELVQAEYVVRYGSPDDTPLEAGVFDGPRGAFFVGYDDGRPVTMGGWRMRSDVRPFGRTRAAELKRMYVAPSARRRGVARVMLAHLEQTARTAGADVMVLETGTGQPEALALYESGGYLPIENYGHYSWSPKARCLARPL